MEQTDDNVLWWTSRSGPSRGKRAAWHRLQPASSWPCAYSPAALEAHGFPWETRTRPLSCFRWSPDWCQSHHDLPSEIAEDWLTAMLDKRMVMVGVFYAMVIEAWFVGCAWQCMEVEGLVMP